MKLRRKFTRQVTKSKGITLKTARRCYKNARQKRNKMNKIKYELLKNIAAISEEGFDGSVRLKLSFADVAEGYLSIGHRIIPIKDGTAEISLSDFGNGIHACYLMLHGEQIELPSIEKEDGLIRTVTNASRGELLRLRMMKELMARIDTLELDTEALKKAVYGRKGIL